jgi:hypothetical protein
MTQYQYVNEFTVSLTDLSPLTDALSALSTAHKESSVRIETGTVRWRGNELWIQVCLAVDGTDESVAKDALAQAAVDTGLAEEYATARNNVTEVTV